MTECKENLKKYTLQNKSETFRLEMLKDIRKFEKNLKNELKEMV